MNWLPAIIAIANPLPQPICGKLTTIGGWVTSILGWGGGIAFVAVGGVFLFAYFGGHGSSRAVRALAGVSIGCVLISAGGAFGNALVGANECGA